MHRIFIVIVFLVSLVSIYIHYLNHQSSKLQWLLYEDIRQNNYKESTTSKFSTINEDFPNLSLSSLPIKGLIARYYMLGGLFTESLELLNDSYVANPYIMFSESIKQEIYETLKVNDSSYYYAEKAFSGIPNNGKHFIALAKAYANKDQYSKVDSIFSIVKESYQNDIYQIYLATWLTNKDSVSTLAKKTAKDAIKVFGDSNPEIRLSADYILYGMDNINEAIEQDAIATDYFFNGQYRLAAIHYEKAAELNPSDYTFFENAGISHFKFGYYDKSIKFLRHVTDSFNIKTGKSEFVLSQAYFNLKDSLNACDFAMKSSRADYREAFELVGRYCK